MKIALACPGIGLVQRGFERLFQDQFDLLKNDVSVTLIKGWGPVGESEKTLPFIHRNGPVVKWLPIHKLFGRTAMHTECLTFALALLPDIRREKYDIVHCIDPPLTRVLYKLRGMLGMNFRLLYTEGCAMPPADYPPADHIQQLSKSSYDEALELGYERGQMTLLPCGIHCERFNSPKRREQLREEHGIDNDTFVILSVAALNRYHKRTDYLIDEVSKLKGNYLLWLDGSLDNGDPDLPELARKKLGDRCRVTHVPSREVADLYRLADMQVHCALFEAFGLALVEGASTGLPMLVHNAAHFQWLMGNPECCMDMRQSGKLGEKIADIMKQPRQLDAMTCQQSARQRFDWENLKQDYIDMYSRVAQMPLPGRAKA